MTLQTLRQSNQQLAGHPQSLSQLSVWPSGVQEFVFVTSSQEVSTMTAQGPFSGMCCPRCGGEGNCVLSPKSPQYQLPRGRRSFQEAVTPSPGEGFGFHSYNKITDKNIQFSAGKIITVIHRVVDCNNINSGDNNSNNKIIIECHRL